MTSSSAKRHSGPSVRGYQPPGVWEEATFGNKRYVQDKGDALYRSLEAATGGGYTVVLQLHDGMNRAARSVAVRVLEPEIR